MKTHTHSRCGFTLLEMLVVIVVIATLAAISFVAATRIKKSADEAVTTENMRQIGVAMISTVADQGHFPYRFPTTDRPRWDRFLLPALGFTDLIPGEIIHRSEVPELDGIARIFSAPDDKEAREENAYKRSFAVPPWTCNANGSPFGRSGPGEELPPKMMQIGRPDRAVMIVQKYTADNVLGQVVGGLSNQANPIEKFGPFQMVVFVDGHIDRLTTQLSDKDFRKLYEPITNGDNK